MSYLPDEQWIMIKDSIDKKNVARSSHNKRSHCGKGGSVKFPSDYMTKKEIKAMNGEVKTYRLNDPMTYNEFKKLPDDIKIAYIKNLREKYAVPNKDLAEAMGVGRGYFGKQLRDLGLGLGKGAAARASKKWPGTPQALAFREFWYGPDEPTEPSIDICEEEVKPVQDNVEVENEPPAATESLLGACAPSYGQLGFYDACIEDILDTIKAILAGKVVDMTITWNILEEKED
jgi:hypothetical protein